MTRIKVPQFYIADVQSLGHSAFPLEHGLKESQMAELGSNTELEAAVFRRMVAHLDKRKDVQNIELMGLAGFCRNCLSKWYVEAAAESGQDIELEEIREMVYGMPYKDWKAQYQTEATPEQLAAFEAHQKEEQGGS